MGIWDNFMNSPSKSIKLQVLLFLNALTSALTKLEKNYIYHLKGIHLSIYVFMPVKWEQHLKSLQSAKAFSKTYSFGGL